MALRICLTAVLALAGALAAQPALAGPGPKDGAAPELVRVVYPVADLVVPVPDGGDGAGQAPRATLEGRLMEMIRKTVRPASWAENGGAGCMEYFPLGMALVVRQSPELQEEVADLLRALRRLQDVEVSVELRVVQLDPDLAGDFHGRAGFAKTAAAEAGKTVETAVLTEQALAEWFKRFQADAATRVTPAPKITMFPGQSAWVRAETQQSYVTEYRVVRTGAQADVVPHHETIDVGMRCRLRPTVSADRRSVTLQLEFRQSHESGPAAVFPVQVRTGQGEAEKTFTGFVQQPRVQKLEVKYGGTIADGRTLALPLGEVMVDAPPLAVPGLGQVPYLGRLFRNGGAGREARSVFLLVTPRVVVNEAEEVPASSLVPRQ